MVFGLILIHIESYDFASPFSPYFWFQLRRLYQTLKTMFNHIFRLLEASTHAPIVFWTRFSLLGNAAGQHALSYLIFVMNSKVKLWDKRLRWLNLRDVEGTEKKYTWVNNFPCIDSGFFFLPPISSLSFLESQTRKRAKWALHQLDWRSWSELYLFSPPRNITYFSPWPFVFFQHLSWIRIDCTRLTNVT